MGFTTEPMWAIMWVSIALGGLAAPMGRSIPSLTAPKRGNTGTIGGIMNFVDNLVDAVAAGYIVGVTNSFNGARLVAGVVLLIAIVSYVVVLGEITPSPDPEAAGTSVAGRPGTRMAS